MKLDKETTGILAEASRLMEGVGRRIPTWGGNTGFESLDKALGYPLTLEYSDYVERYRRQDIAHRVIKSPVDLTWSQEPSIAQSDVDETVFETEWIKLTKDMSLYSRFYKADILGELGRYSVLFLGTGGSNLATEITYGSELVYVNGLSEGSVSVYSWDENLSSDRFGHPLLYKIDVRTGGGDGETRIVHWSRVIHIAKNTLENDFYGIPALQPIYNRLIGLEKLASGSPEMYWRGARPGYVASTKENVLATAKTVETFKEEISKFVNNLNRYLYAEDLSIQSLAPQVVTPREHVDVQIELISAATRIPKRILVGSERGELSSDQDERAWLTFIEGRRETVASDIILRPFIDRLIKYGMLPEPDGGYVIRWEPLLVVSEKEKAETVRLYADAIKKYDESLSIRDFIPPEVFAEHVMGFGEEVLAKMDFTANDYLEREVGPEAEPEE